MTGTLGRLHHGADEPRAAAGDQHVEIAVETHHLRGRLARWVAHQLHRARGQVRLSRGGQAVHHGAVGQKRLRAAAQQAGVCALEAQARRVRSDVGPRLIDDADHADGHAPFLDGQAVGPAHDRIRPADRVRQRRDLAQAVRHAGDASGGKRQPVQQRLAPAGRARGGQVLRVGGKDCFRARLQRVRHGEQRAVARARIGCQQLIGCSPGALRLFKKCHRLPPSGKYTFSKYTTNRAVRQRRPAQLSMLSR